MQRKRTILRTLTDTAVFILLEIAALNMLIHNGSLQNFFVAKAAHGFMGYGWGVTESVKHYFSLASENKRLSEEIFRLNKELAEWKVMKDSMKLDELSSSYHTIGTASDGFSYMPATVVKKSLNKQHNYLIIGKGSEDGVKPQSGIITSEGVVGIVDAVSRHYSYAISFLNTELSISARIGDDGAAGPMVWDGKNGALLREIPLQYKFEPGDTVYTSGYSSIFPADIPLGTTGETKIVNGATYEVKIKLFQEYSALRYVTIVHNNNINEITDLAEGKTEEVRK